jgi:hypothetical protein
LGRVPAWRREAEVLVAAELGASDVRWVEWGDLAPSAGTALPRIVLSAVGHAAPADERARVFRDLALAVVAGGVAVVVDHNRPRRLPAALVALVGAPWVPGASPAARWRRLAHPTAREVQAAGFRVERMRFVAGERVQVVVATRLSK